MKENRLIAPGMILTLGIIISAIIIAATWRQNSKMSQTITVTGSAKKEIVSDLGFLRGTITTRAMTAGAAYNELISQKPVVLEFLKSKGIESNKVNFFTISNYPVYEISSTGMQTQNIVGQVYSQRFEINSSDVNKIKEISLEISELVNKGVDLMVEMPEYHYSKMADLKIEIQAEAARDAMKRAEKIAASTDRDLGPLRTARMGVIQITPRFSNMISDYGVNDLSSIEKEITAVVNASFEID